MITLFLNAIQNFVSLISFAQFANQTIFLSAEIPFHWYPLVINVSTIGYAINTINKMMTGARKSAAVWRVFLCLNCNRDIPFSFIFFCLPFIYYFLLFSSDLKYLRTAKICNPVYARVCLKNTFGICSDILI